MTRTAALVVLLLLTPQSTPSEVKRAITEKLDHARALLDQLPADPPPVTVVRQADNLQAALDAGGTIETEWGAIFTGSFTVRRSGTIWRGGGAHVTAATGPALYIPPDVDHVEVSDLTATSASTESVIKCGDNGPTQTAIEQMPVGIVFRNITIPKHRGKRGFEIHCSGSVIDSKALDVYSSAGAENQALWVGNSCGPFSVLGGEYVGASENIMVGGDVMKMPCIPTVLLFDGLTLTKPDEWREKKIPVKNLFELKAGRSVILRNSWLSGSWVSGQEGTAIVLTPRNGAYLQDITIDNVTVDRVALGIQLLGVNNVTATPAPTSGIVVKNSRFTMSKAENGGRGILALFVQGVQDVTFADVDATFDGTALFVADGSVPQGPVSMRDSRVGLGTYAVMAPGANFGNVPTGTYVGREFKVILERNDLTPGPSMSATGLAAVKKNFPANTFLER